MELARSSEKKKQSLKQHLLEKMKTWINGLLEGERDEFLGRDRHVPLDEGHDNYRNGYRPRRINFFGLGKIELKVPRDRKGELESQWLPERKGQDPELEAFLAEAFLAGLSTRDLARISEKHLGHKYDSKQISRIVGRATTELEAWRRRCVQGQRYKFLYVDGANFLVRINGHVSRQSFCAVLGVSEENERFEVLALEMGDRERADLWASLFEAFVFFTHAQYRTEALPAHVPVNAHQKVGPVHVEKLITLALQAAPAPGLEFRGGSPHDARDLLGVVLMPQVLLRNPRQIPGRQSRQKSFR